ncbi:conserved hypothetical protein [Mucor ambiguus]|uniref:FAS1 domain-containing protein n=1 Tax=Mucor ambiguus TaxID=91626 RepID=A0A0C9MLN4_9FUNG|nr:conserved hypothetical protein [Mucor ambiguus]
MRIAYPTVSILLGLTAVCAQQQQQNPSSNVTILQALNDTNSSPALKFVQFLQSSPDYQSILDILNDPSSNVTLFVPSDQVYYEATGQQPPAPAPVSNTTTGTNSTNATMPSSTAVAGGGPAASSTTAAPAASSSDGGIAALLSSILSGRTSSAAQPAQPTLAPATTGVPQNNPVASGLSGINMARYVKIPNAEVVQPYERFASDASGDAKDAHSLVMRALLIERQQQQQQNNASDWKSVTTDAPFVDQFSFTDLLTYHLVNGSVQLNNTQNATIILNTLLTNSTVDKLGYGLPVLLQQQQQQQDQQQQGGQGQGQGQGQQNQTQGLWQQLQQQQAGGNSNSSNGSGGNWTVGSGLGYANIMTNETIQASNGMVYIIDKILVPPVSPTDTLHTIQNASFFEWLLTKSTENSTLDSTSNITIFVPTNDALQNLNFTELNNDTLEGALKAHIVSGVYYTTNLTSEPTTVESVGGTNITLTNSDPTNNNSVTVNDAHIVQGNILLNNGVMHLIDSILTFPTVESPNGSGNGTENGNSTGAGPFPAPQTSTESMAVSTGMPMTGSAFALLLCAVYVCFFSL